VRDRKLAAEMLAFADLSAAVTRNRLGFGHPATYFAGGFDAGHGYTSRHANEAFANWFALTTSDNGAWRKILQQQLPRLYEAAQKLLERIGKDANGG
jgi:hypothetical protein